MPLDAASVNTAVTIAAVTSSRPKTLPILISSIHPYSTKFRESLLMFAQVAAMAPFLSTGFFTPLSEGATLPFAFAPSRLAPDNCSSGRLYPSDKCRRL
jgi:hypothetical protein